ncbi:ALDH-like protein, partial [Cylindrobasidium torrendii FP15055 ss-10]
MSKVIHAIFHPLSSLGIWPEEYVFDVAVVPTLFIAFGIWLVVQRYERAHNSPIVFRFRNPPEAVAGWTSHVLDNPALDAHLHDPKARPTYVARDRQYITSFDPASGLHIGTFMADDAEVIAFKIQQAADAQKTWKHTSWRERRRVIRSLLKWLVDNQDLCARIACRDTGKTMVDAALGEILTTCSKLEWLLNYGEQTLRPEKRRSNFMLMYKKQEVHYEPLGVVAGLVSWNYPLHNAWSPILAGIFSGNGVVLKCSEQVIWSSTWFVEIIQNCLKACGHSPDLVQVVCCLPQDADAVTRSPLIKHITFIGSEEVGRKVAVAATEHLTPVTLELGGKDPAVILPNTNLDQWISVWMRGVFQNSGQNCIGIERLIVHKRQYDELHQMFVERTTKLRQGAVLAPTDQGYLSTVDVGAMISPHRFGGLEHELNMARQYKGEHEVEVEGGRRYNHVFNSKGCYFEPTVVGPVTIDMPIAHKELFAPVAILMPYDSIEEAIDIANSTRYGLGASVFGPDQNLCMHVAKQLECGMVAINDFGVFYVNQDLPFGGVKASGYGRFGGPEGLRSLTNPKAIMTDRFPALAQTSIPKVLDYPIKSLRLSWVFLEGLVRFLYADGWRPRIAGLLDLIHANSQK